MLPLIAAAGAAAGALGKAGSKPNLIFVITDDQDVLLGGLEPMPITRKWLQEGGATLSNYFVNTPICCPSRSEYVSGKYYHNHGAPGGNCMHVDAEAAVFGPHSVFSTLQAAGYATGVFGKVTNDQTHYFCPAHPDKSRREWLTAGSQPPTFITSPGNNVVATHCQPQHCHDAGPQPTEAACQALCERNSTCLWYTLGAGKSNCWLGYSPTWEPWKSGGSRSGCKQVASFPACRQPPPARGRADGMTYVNAPCDCESSKRSAPAIYLARV